MSDFGDFPGSQAAAQKVAHLVAGRPDADVAKDIKAEMIAKLEEVCAAIDRAKAAGFEVTFNLGKRWDGKEVITHLTVAKHF